MLLNEKLKAVRHPTEMTKLSGKTTTVPGVWQNSCEVPENLQ